MDFRRVIEANRESYMDELFEVLRQKSISAQNDGIRECAELMMEKLRGAGIGHVELMETEIHPVVYGEYHVSDDAPTILIYGHYDVQPPDPIGEWESLPFEPTIRDGRIYARGAGDNKGQIMAQIMAIRTYLEAEGELPVNVKFLIEGEEEIGSVNLDSFVAQHREKLEADLVYTSDGRCCQTVILMCSLVSGGCCMWSLRRVKRSSTTIPGIKGTSYRTRHGN